MVERTDDPQTLLSKIISELENPDAAFSRGTENAASNLIVVDSKRGFRSARRSVDCETSWLKNRTRDLGLLVSRGSTFIAKDGGQLYPVVYAREGDKKNTGT